MLEVLFVAVASVCRKLFGVGAQHRANIGKQAGQSAGVCRTRLHALGDDDLMGAVDREGMTIVPLKMFFNDKGRAKIEIALGRGKKLHDKRETEKKRSWERERGRLMRLKG